MSKDDDDDGGDAREVRNGYDYVGVVLGEGIKEEEDES